ncbi:MAG TPA: DUF899 family protein [Jiangellaceae bacterium]|jgi:hypothetical protein|nr:DUF899 family protein [Jiangellaceae bacterium]
MSAFALADGAVYHTYSTYARGLEFLMGYYPILDRAPKGRDEGASSEFLDPATGRVRIGESSVEQSGHLTDLRVGAT